MTTQEVLQHLQQAIGCLQRGEIAAAEGLLTAILSAHPDQPDALHYLGVAALQARQPAKAIELIGRSLAIAPNFGAYNNLGQAFRAAGRVDEAIACFEQSLRLQPDHPDAHLNLALLLIHKSQHEQALRLLQRLVQIAPQHPVGHFWLAVTYAQLEFFERAASAFRAHLQMHPDHAEAHGRLATVLSHLNQHDAAVSAARRSVELAPQAPEAANNLGWCLERAGKVDEAITAYQRAIDRNGQFVMALGNLGSLLDKTGQSDRAIDLFEQARRADPNHLEVLNSLAGLYSRSGRYADTLATAEAALKIRPHDASARGHRALALLSFGEYEKGFAEYEWRWECKDFTTPVRAFDQPRWTGRSDPAGRTVLIHCEQGFGDNIQFARYLPMLADRGARIILECPVALCGLMEKVRGVDRVVAAGVRPPRFDLQAPLLSLAHAFGTTLSTVPSEVPYIAAPPDRVEAWRRRLGGYDGRRIGLVWRGNQKPNPRRSIPLQELAPLASAAPRAQFVSLQVGKQGEEADSPPAGMNLLDLRNDLKDFLDTAAVLSLLDLVITIDTAAAHLAGAMGRPTWTLLIKAADWRWLQDRDDSPWYPTMRLYRQHRPDDWSSLVQRVAADLGEWCGR